MQQTLIDQQWVDIVQPTAAQGSAILWWLGMGLIVAACILYYFLHYRRPRQQLRRYIRTLNKRVAASKDYKFILYQLEHRLCPYHGITTLAERKMLSREWRTLMESLIGHRYQKQQPTSGQTREILQQCLHLLKTKTLAHAE